MYTRKIDQLGRVILPATYRQKLNMVENTEVEFFIDEENQTIILMKREDVEKEE